MVECKADRNARNKFSMSPLDLCPHADEKKWKFLFTVVSLPRLFSSPVLYGRPQPAYLESSVSLAVQWQTASRARRNSPSTRSMGKFLLCSTKHQRATEPLAAPLMELPLLRDEPEYYESIINPLSFSLISVRPFALLLTHADPVSCLPQPLVARRPCRQSIQQCGQLLPEEPRHPPGGPRVEAGVRNDAQRAACQQPWRRPAAAQRSNRRLNNPHSVLQRHSLWHRYGRGFLG